MELLKNMISRLDYLLKKITEERDVQTEKQYQKLIELGGLYDLYVREADKLVKELF